MASKMEFSQTNISRNRTGRINSKKVDSGVRVLRRMFFQISARSLFGIEAGAKGLRSSLFAAFGFGVLSIFSQKYARRTPVVSQNKPTKNDFTSSTLLSELEINCLLTELRDDDARINF